MRNFIGQSVHAWRQRVRDLLPQGRCDEADEHFLDSSWSSVKQLAAQASTTASSGEHRLQSGAARDFSCSTFALVALCSHWAQKGPRKGSKWNLKPQAFQTRCAALLQGLCTFFLKAEHTSESAPSLRINSGDLVVNHLVGCVEGKPLAKTFAGVNSMTVVDALRLLLHDSSSKNFGSGRRDAALYHFSALVALVSDVVEQQRDLPLWKAKSIADLEQLRLAGPCVREGVCTNSENIIQKKKCVVSGYYIW